MLAVEMKEIEEETIKEGKEGEEGEGEGEGGEEVLRNLS